MSYLLSSKFSKTTNFCLIVELVITVLDSNINKELLMSIPRYMHSSKKFRFLKFYSVED